MIDRILALAGLLGALAPGAAARAADAALPMFLAVPPPSAAAPVGGDVASAPLAGADSIYRGLYVGTEVFGVAGGKGRGGFGGDVYAGYARPLESGALLDIQGGAGRAPALWGGPGPKGWSFGEASATLGYPMGRVTPFVTAGLAVARPEVGGGLIAPGAAGGIDDLMNGGGSLRAAPRVGAGFSYALTPNTAVSFDVQVGRGLAGGLP